MDAMTRDADRYFDDLYKHSDDPWNLRNGWYERRKRSLTLAALPRERYRNAFEPGCANGELTAELATRCDTLLAVDLHERAVRAARERVAHAPQVRVEQCAVPREWPTQSGPFDLIVVSELAYYLDDNELDMLAARIADTLSSDGTLLACHWRWPFAEALQETTKVHALLDTRCGLTRLVHHEEADFIIDVWSRDARSVAQHEGLL